MANLPPAALARWVLVPVGVPDSVPVAPLPVQLSAVAQEGSGGWPMSLGPALSWETRRKYLAPGFGSAQRTSHSGHLGGEPTEGRPFSLSLSHCLTLPVKKKNEKRKCLHHNKFIFHSSFHELFFLRFIFYLLKGRLKRRDRSRRRGSLG